MSLEREKSQTHSLYQPDCVCASFLNVSSLYCYIYFSLSLFMFFFRSNKISIQMLLLLGKFVLNEDRRQAFRGNFFFSYTLALLLFNMCVVSCLRYFATIYDRIYVLWCLTQFYQCGYTKLIQNPIVFC